MTDSIEDKFLERNDLFGLQFNSGFVFFEVANVEQTKYKPYTGLSDLQGGDSYSDFKRIEDEDGDDILHVPDDDADTILHVGIGHRPHFLRRYTDYNDGQIRLRGIPNLQKAVTRDSFGYVDGYDTPYDEPSSVEELFIPHGPHPTFNFKNPDDDNHKPKLNIKMAKYSIRPLDPNVFEDANAIERIMSPGSPMPTPPAGKPARRIDYSSALKQKWGVEAISADHAKNATNEATR